MKRALKPTLSLALAFACVAAIADDEAAPRDARFVPKLEAIAKEYKSYKRADDAAHWSPLLCRAPAVPLKEGGKLRRSESDDDATHGRKLYYLYARQAMAYIDHGPKSTQPVGQVIVKEAFAPVEAKEGEEGDAVSDAGRRYRAGEAAGLFVMMKVDAETKGTDKGWVYGTIAADGTVTAAGRLASCIACHEEAESDRLFGLPRRR